MNETPTEQRARKARPAMIDSTEPRTAIIVDQHPLWLDQIESVVTLADAQVLAKTTSSKVALDQVEQLRPQLLITEIWMRPGEIDGITLIQTARDRVPGLKVVVLSMYEDAEHVDAAFAAGAAVYVVKTAHADDLTSGIRQAFRHSIFVAGARLIAATPDARSVDDDHGLTRREMEILGLVSEGHSNAQLARMLWVTEQTVKFHLSNIYRKLDVSNRTEASRWAQRQGLLPTEPPVHLHEVQMVPAAV